MSWIPSYKKPAGGSSYVPCDWATGTDEEIVEALEKHYAGEVDLHEYWSIGDERIIHLNALNTYAYNIQQLDPQPRDMPFVLTQAGGKTLADGVTECAFQVDQKYCFANTRTMGYYTSGWSNCDARSWCNDTYKNAFPSTIVPIFKQFVVTSLQPYTYNTPITTTDYFTFRAVTELDYTQYTRSGRDIYLDEGSQVEYYLTTANRIKYNIAYLSSLSQSAYWTRTEKASNSGNYYYMYDGEFDANNVNSGNSYNRGYCPFGVI